MVDFAKEWWERALGAAAVGVDRAFAKAIERKGVPANVESISHEERIETLGRIRDAYDRASLVELFPEPNRVRPTLSVVRSPPGMRVLDASWPSDFVPYVDDLREGYRAHTQNRTARARLYLADKPRPAIILVHGYMGGYWLWEERQWPLSWLSQLGLDVALPILPFHALRGDGGPPRFPSADGRYTNEGLRQAVFDIRALVQFLLDRGAPSVGIGGMSLGGYTSALLATLEDKLAFAVPIVPLASFADFARDHGHLTGSEAEQAAQHAAIEEANRMTSPLSRTPRVDPDRILVVAAQADHVTPTHHAERLARHFGARHTVMRGGHIVQFGRRDAFRELARMLSEHRIIAPPRVR